MSLERRISRLEQAQEQAETWRNYQRVAAEYGFDAHELWEEGERFLSMSLEDQLADVDRLAPDLIAEGVCTAAEIDETKAILTKYYQP